MPYALGIDLGSGHLTAALCRNDRERWAEPEVLALDGSPATESVLHLTDEGTVEVGSRALPHVTTRPDRITRGFVDRVGDEVPIILGGQPYPAEVLIAAVVGWIADYAEASEGVPASQLVVTHPAGWSSHRRATLLGALREVSLPELTLLPRPVAAAESYAATERVEVGQEIAVHSLGASRFESAVLRRGSFGFELRAHANSVEAMGGDLFDDLVAARVLAELDTEVEPVALAKLRAACRTAKERLSTELAVPVPAPARSMRGTVMVNRTDLEELIRPVVEVTVAALQRTIQAAGTSTGALRAVVLVGGSGRIPLVSELVSAGVRVRVAAAADSELSVARGAALAAARVAKPTVQAPAVKTALAHKPKPIPSSAITHTDLMSFDDLPPEDIADIGPPPPRPPVDITPLEPPKRRLLRLGARSTRADEPGPNDDDDLDRRPIRRRADATTRDADEPDDLVDYDLDLVPEDAPDDDLDLDPSPPRRRRSTRPPHTESGKFDLDAGPRPTEFDLEPGPHADEPDLDRGRPRRRPDHTTREPDARPRDRRGSDEPVLPAMPARPHLADRDHGPRPARPGMIDDDRDPMPAQQRALDSDLDAMPARGRGPEAEPAWHRDADVEPAHHGAGWDHWSEEDDARPRRNEPESWPNHAEDGSRAGRHSTSASRAMARRHIDSGSAPRPWTGPDADPPASRHDPAHHNRTTYNPNPPAGRHGLDAEHTDDPRAGYDAALGRHGVDAMPARHTGDPWIGHDAPDRRAGQHTGAGNPDIPASRHGIDSARHTDDSPAGYDSSTGRHGLDAAPAPHTDAPWAGHDPPAGRHGLDVDDAPVGRHGRDTWPAPRRRRRLTDDRAFNESLSRHAGTDDAGYDSHDEGDYDRHYEGDYEVADEPRRGRDLR